jgi:putative (di)nucleoside polyphosphate hydrolase
MTIERPIGHSEPLDLPYRIGVGILLIDRRGLVWTGRRRPKWAGTHTGLGQGHIWQLPQGGLQPGEDPLDAAYRELEEETGIRSADLVAELNTWTTYDLPPELIGVALKGRYRGQRQRWFAMRFFGDDSEIDIGPRNGCKAEFDRWRWRPVGELPELAIPYKRALYSELSRVFGPHARPVA